jgi:hypothetical protein
MIIHLATQTLTFKIPEDVVRFDKNAVYRPGTLVTDEDLLKICPANRPLGALPVDEAVSRPIYTCKCYHTLRSEIEESSVVHNEG